ncbi:hypothetical protein MLD38_030958 [Melastoma candidum]|uniref:Uncharacterized protein n=1 Tax=Melastoma candidum TaxID=119954 RepID=A0ACB9MMM9_9MYRT|nr:hypothetical protein MLD38_030958 [Melastoma candidum]
MLMACAQSVQQNNLVMAEALVKYIGVLAASQVGAMRKVATYFAEALARQIYGIQPQGPSNDPTLQDMYRNRNQNRWIGSLVIL